MRFQFFCLFVFSFFRALFFFRFRLFFLVCRVGWSFTRIIIEKMEHWGLNVVMGRSSIDKVFGIVGLVAGCERRGIRQGEIDGE